MDNLATYVIETAKDGYPTLIVCDGTKRIPLHSTHRPSQEGNAFKAQFNPEKFDVLIVIGTGLGYHLSGIATIAHKYRQIILIDYLKGLEEKIKQNTLTSFLSTLPNIVFLCGLSEKEITEKLTSFIEMDCAKGIQVLEHPPSVRLFSAYYLKVKSDIQSIINRTASNIITRAAFSRRFFKNAAINLKNFSLHLPFAALCKQFKDFAALVVAAAPSLDINIEKIRNNRNRILIIAVDSAIPSLAQHNIEPDFFVSIDPQPMVFEHVRHIKISPIPLITLTSHPYAFLKSPGFLSLNTHPWAQFLQEALPFEVGTFNSASGSVAGDALLAAIKMGFSHIGIVGFDSAFVHYCTYAKGSAYHRRWSIVFQNRFSPVETKNFYYILKASGATVQSGFYTRKSFINYYQSVNDLVAKNADNSVYHILPTALPLSNASVCSFEEFIARCPKNAEAGRSKINSIILQNDHYKNISFIEIKSLLTKEVLEKIIEASFERVSHMNFEPWLFLKRQKYLNQ